MNEEREFILNNIKNLLLQFPETMIGYEYEKDSLIHFFKIKPVEIFESKSFKKSCMNILLNYIDRYKGSLCFISEKDLILLNKPEIFFNPGKLIIYDTQYKIKNTTSKAITNTISSPNNCLNNKYSLAA